ncbi:hypothetical protein EPUS_00111 [Endocarpon pusillum Z07020]|uniref:DUF7223 domain-containing protein n=1 Tax=Endocarpon pusillum (strain Z07020 / HMAS-L-300199) TaxID=1263415 RepID=U1I0D3_ENDPU|nr:uncharacterized protein EPUS_00111 [Endocarpon pusillum Z07020]ERF75319.1 hypothetical protein EPUS_00111 [Endocarpon pusillum Z07020]
MTGSEMFTCACFFQYLGQIAKTSGVSTVSLNEDINNIVLSTTPMPWENMFHKMDAGHRTESATSTPITASATSNSIAFPPAPTTTPGDFNVSGNIASELIDTQILPPDFNVDGLLAVAPEMWGLAMTLPYISLANNSIWRPKHERKVQNCSVQGTISLFQGFFSIENTRESASDETMIIEFFTEDGYLELRADNVAAHIELESSIESSIELAAVEIPLPSVGLPGFMIPGIATVGPMLMPIIEIGAQFSAQIDFTYGFDLMIPNNSTIIINMAELANSTETGFRDASLAPLPFQASVPSLTVTLSVGFLPRLLLGISIGSASVVSFSAGAGAIFGLPKLETRISQVADVNERCEALNTTAADDDDDDNDDAFDFLTLIEPSVVLDVELIAEADIDVGVTIDINATYPLLSTAFPLPTACLSYDADAESYAPAAIADARSYAPAAIDATVEEGDGGQGSGGMRLGVGRLKMLVSLLVGVMAVFVGM